MKFEKIIVYELFNIWVGKTFNTPTWNGLSVSCKPLIFCPSFSDNNEPSYTFSDKSLTVRLYFWSLFQHICSFLLIMHFTFFPGFSTLPVEPLLPTQKAIWRGPRSDQLTQRPPPHSPPAGRTEGHCADPLLDALGPLVRHHPACTLTPPSCLPQSSSL